jgi:branched-chain amino acid transport system permease protein
VVELIIVLTLVAGGVYALLAIGFSLIFGSARVINMAHTAFFMVAAYGMRYFMRELGLGAIASIAITVPAVTILGLLAYWFLINRIREHHAAVLLMTVAIALVFQQIFLGIVASTHLSSHPAPLLIEGSSMILGVTVQNQQLLSLGIAAAVIVIVWLVLAKTKLGIAIRATAQDAEIANLMGISVPRTLMVTMGIATALAAVAAVMMAPLRAVEPYMWGDPLIMVLVIVVLGGLGSIKGSIIGAFIVALVEALVITLMPSGAYLKLMFAMLVMIIVLVVRPGGLFGIVFEEERL